MTREEIVDKAKYVVFPNSQANGYKEGYDAVTDGKEVIFLPVIDMRYAALVGNEHHFTTEYHRRYVMPALERLFQMGYREEDFYIRPNIIGSSDLSYLVPKTDTKFQNTDFLSNLQFGCSFEGLGNANLQREIGYSTPYHHLYTFAHSCSRIVNLTNRNGRRLFISGDSQMVPSIRTLACLFEEVWYFDNRTDKEIKDVYKDVEFTDVLIELYMGDIRRYTDTNLK